MSKGSVKTTFTLSPYNISQKLQWVLARHIPDNARHTSLLESDAIPLAPVLQNWATVPEVSEPGHTFGVRLHLLSTLLLSMRNLPMIKCPFCLSLGLDSNALVLSVHHVLSTRIPGLGKGVERADFVTSSVSTTLPELRSYSEWAWQWWFAAHSTHSAG